MKFVIVRLVDIINIIINIILNIAKYQKIRLKNEFIVDEI